MDQSAAELRMIFAISAWKRMHAKTDEIHFEYDFSNGVRGKHAAALANGHTTIITKSDGSTITVESSPVFLESDVREYFPDTESVNQALRGLIALVPDRHA